jgi:hypothetical protein
VVEPRWKNQSEREGFMLYLVEAHPSVERANVVDAGEGPGSVIAKIVERFRPKAIYGNPSRRQVFMVVELGRTDVCPRLVCRCRAHIHSAHVGGDLWRSDRQREEDYKAA